VAIERRHLPGLRELWTDPRVMANMGFPGGLDPADLDLESYLATPGEVAPRGRRPGLHLAVERPDGTFVGEAKLAAPDASGTCEPDVKLLPAWWRRGYGEEIVRWLIAESFRRWEACRHVQFTPSETNHAALSLYAKVGCQEVGRGHAPPGASPLRGFAGVCYRVLQVARPPDPGPASRDKAAPPPP
jgi:RimJ/RimL family protein N-acetyltransferase